MRSLFKRGYWESSYVDLWSVGHFFAGASFGFTSLFFPISIQLSSALFIFGAILWEVAEYVNGGGEKNFSNVFSDVVVGAAGFFFSWFVFPWLFPNYILASFIVILIITLLVQTVSWYQVYYYRMGLKNNGKKPSKLLTTKIWKVIKDSFK